MSLLTQKTLKKIIKISGIGLHTGIKTNVKIVPSTANSGIVFRRVDIDRTKNTVIPNFLNVTDTLLCTTIENEFGTKVSTIEHLMAALYGVGIDNALIEIDNQEIPILDGSAVKWVELIKKSGIEDSGVPIKIIKIENKIEVKDGTKFINIDKSNVSLDIDFEIKYPDCLIETQRNKVNIFNDNLDDIYKSRTFCKFDDIDKLKSLGLAKGGSLENALVVKNHELLNKEGLRNKKEFVNHKILDCMGDLYLSGYKIIGSVSCSQGGHSLTNKLLRKIFNNKSNYSLIELKGKSLPHTLLHFHKLKSIA